MTDKSFDDLTEKIQELDRARRELAQALDVSRIGAVEGDRWPRRLDQPRGIDRRPFLLCVAAVVLAAAFMTRQWTAAPEAAPPSAASIALAPMAATPVATVPRPAQATSAPAPEAIAPANVAPTPALTPLVVHIKVVRACSVRIVVDDVPLEWRTVRPGDEMISRPARDVIIETDDAGALVVRVNGVPTSLGTDNAPATRRFLR